MIGGICVLLWPSCERVSPSGLLDIPLLIECCRHFRVPMRHAFVFLCSLYPLIIPCRNTSRRWGPLCCDFPIDRLCSQVFPINWSFCCILIWGRHLLFDEYILWGSLYMSTYLLVSYFWMVGSSFTTIRVSHSRHWFVVLVESPLIDFHSMR